MDSIGSAPHPLRRRHVFWLLALATVFLALRLLTILTAVDQTCPSEELYRGAIAKELVEGLKMPWFDYQADAYSGGSLAMGLVAAPFFAALGPSLFALKCAAIFFSLGAFVGLFLFLNRFFSLRAAIYGALLFIFSPPAFTQLSLASMGFHSQSYVIGVFTLLFFYNLMLSDPRSPAVWSAVLFGVASGLGISFTYITVEVPLTCLLCWAVFDQRFVLRRSFLLFGMGLAIGLVPWAMYNVTHHFDGLRFVAAAFDPTLDGSVKTTPWTLVKKLGRLAVIDTPQSLFFQPVGRIPGAVVSRVYIAIVVVACCWLAVASRGRRWPDGLKRGLPFLVYPVLFFLIFTVSRFDPGPDRVVGFRYFSPLHFWFFPVLAIAADAMPIGRAGLVILLVLGLHAQRGLVWQEPFGKALQYKGYSYYALGEQVSVYGFALADRAHDLARWASRYSGDDRRYFVAGALSELPDDGKTGIRKLEHELQTRPPEYRPFLFELMPDAFGCDPAAWAAIGRAGGDAARAQYFRTLFLRPECVRPYAANAAALPVDAQQWFYIDVGDLWFRGVLYGNEGWFQKYALADWEMAKDVIRRAPATANAWIYEGAGRSAGDRWVNVGGSFVDSRHAAEFAVPSQYQANFLIGVGWSVRNGTLEDPVRALTWIDQLPADSRADAMTGVRAWGAWYGFAR